MDHSSFTVTTGTATTTVPPPRATSAPASALPISMIEQSPPSALGPDPVGDAPMSAAPAEVPAADPTAEVAAPPAEQPAEAPAPLAASPAETQAKVDPRFSALARKEAALHREREAIKAAKATVEEAHRQVVAFEEARHAAKRDPLAALQALGISYDELTEQMLNGSKPTPSGEVAAIRQEIEQLRVEQEQARSKAEQAATARLAAEQQSIIDDARQAALAHVEANATRYTLTRINDGASLVPQVREQHFARTGQLLTIEQAAGLVEKHFEGIADRVVKARGAVPTKTTAATPSASSVATTPASASRTLSNALTASPSTAPVKARTEADRIRAALARLDGK